MSSTLETRPLRFGGASPAAARRGVVLIHGRGASAENILGLGDALGVAEVAYAAPQAPGSSWWPTSFLAPMAQMEGFVGRGIAAVEDAIAALVEGGVPRDRIVVAGFSQGACLALEYAARRGGVAAAFGLSGGLVGTAEGEGGPMPELYGHAPKRFDYDTDLAGVPVYVSVHQEDPHIPLARASESARRFEDLGAEVRFHVKPGAGHGIDETDIAALRAVLNRP